MNDKLFIKNLLHATLNLNSRYLNLPFNSTAEIDYHLREILWGHYDYQNFAKDYIREIQPHTIYFIVDSFSAHYVLISLIASEEILCLGPYLEEPVNDNLYFKIIERNKLTSNVRTPLKAFYNKLPILDSVRVMETVNTIATFLYHCTEYQIEHKYLHPDSVPSNLDTLHTPTTVEHTLTIEKLYKIENQLLESVSKGDSQSALLYLRTMNQFNMTSRHHDILREQKNRLITLNTLYRKAVEKAHIHPIYLDEISAQYAIKIEQMTSSLQATELALKITRDYCLLVKNHSLKKYSPLIQTAINYIHLNLSSPLSLNTIAHYMNVNPSYLSSQFKTEVHSTLTTYVTNERLHTALNLLSTTTMQVQDIAWYVGIQDVNYFSRIFKKNIGVTPTAYRNQLHHSTKS